MGFEGRKEVCRCFVPCCKGSAALYVSCGVANDRVVKNLLHWDTAVTRAPPPSPGDHVASKGRRVQQPTLQRAGAFVCCFSRLARGK